MIRILEIRHNPATPQDPFTVVYDAFAVFHPYPLYEALAAPGCHVHAAKGKHLGAKITFDDLPDWMQRAVIDDLEYDPRTTDPDTDPAVIDRMIAYITHDLSRSKITQLCYLVAHTKHQLMMLAKRMGFAVTTRTPKYELTKIIQNRARAIAYAHNRI